MKRYVIALTLAGISIATLRAGEGVYLDATALLPNHTYASGAFVGSGTQHTRLSGGSPTYCTWNAGTAVNINSPAFTTDASGQFHGELTATSGTVPTGNSIKRDALEFDSGGAHCSYEGTEQCQGFAWKAARWSITGPPPAQYQFLLSVTNGCGTFTPDVPGTKTYQLIVGGIVKVTRNVLGSRNPRIPTQASISYTDYPAIEGTAWSWTEDGVPIFNGSETNVTTEGAGSSESRVVCTNNPAPTPSPTLTPRPTPTATVAPSPYPTTTPGPTAPPTTPNPSVAPSSTTIVTVTNIEDFYSAVKRALNDAGNGSTASFAGDPYTNNADPTPPAIETSVTDYKKAAGEVMAKITEAGLQAKANFRSLPTNLGTECEIILPTAWAFGEDTTINLCDWSAQIAVLRMLCLWLVTVSMAFLYLGAITYQYD